MSGSSSAAQAFETTYGGAAISAGQQLGVSPAIVLSQWALESGYGTSSAAASGNLAGLQTQGANRNYGGDVNAFVSDYVQTIKQYWPGAVNTGDNADAFVTALTSKTSGGSGVLGNYFGTDETAATYENKIIGAASTLAVNTPAGSPSLGTISSPASGLAALLGGNSTSTGATGSTGGAALTPLNPTASTAGTTAGATGCSGLGSLFTWACLAPIAADMGIIILGMGMILIGVVAGVRQSPVEVIGGALRA